MVLLQVLSIYISAQIFLTGILLGLILISLSLSLSHPKDSAGTKKSSNTGIVIGAAVGGSVLALLSLLVGIYAFRQKRRAERADKVNNPFGKTGTSLYNVFS